MSQLICDECGEPIIDDVRCEPCFGPLAGTPEWFWHEDNSESRIEATAEVWDEYADAFFEAHGYEGKRMAYNTERATGTLWVLIDVDEEHPQYPEVWKNTYIPAHEADRLLTEGWDNAEAEAYERWCKAEGFDEVIE